MAGVATIPRLGALSTPRRLQLSLAVIAALAMLSGGTALWTARAIADAAQTIGRDAEPSVALALRMEATLADMNAAALADALIDGGAASGTSERFLAGSRSLAADMVEAARNITYGEAEAAPLRGLVRWVTQYQVAVAESRSYGQGDAWVTSRRVQWASRVNRDFAAPEAAALAEANAGVLERRYDAYRAGSLVLAGLGVAAFGLLVAALVAVQLWLARRTRRRVNPFLAAATLVAALTGVWFGAACVAERADLRAAKTDAYDSLHVLFQAKGAANALRADASMWLLDAPTRPASMARMDADMQALLGTGLAMSEVDPAFGPLDAALVRERAGDVAGALATAPHLGGYLGAELGNVTFGVAERQPATDSIHRLVDAALVVRGVEALERQGGHGMAVARWTGAEAGSGGAAFASLQDALDRTIEVNQSEFDRRVGSALATAGVMPLVSSGALMLVLALAAGGLWQRLRDYR